MSKTKNKYDYPIDPEKIIKTTYTESQYHRGRWKHSVDFIVPEGTPIRAAAFGKVIAVMTRYRIGGPEIRFDPFGNYIEIEHKNGEYSYYEHLRKNEAIVKVGEQVKMDQVIGFSGATGYLAHLGPHLHFAVLKYGSTIREFETLEIVWRKNINRNAK